MTITLANKKAVVEEVTAVASKAISAVVADYRGGGHCSAYYELEKICAHHCGVFLFICASFRAAVVFERVLLFCAATDGVAVSYRAVGCVRTVLCACASCFKNDEIAGSPDLRAHYCGRDGLGVA